MLWGELRPWQFYLAVRLGAAATVGLWRLFARFTKDPDWTFRRAVVPGLVVQGLLLLLYLLEAMPPVPLSLKYIGVYNEVEVGQEASERPLPASVRQPPPFWQLLGARRPQSFARARRRRPGPSCASSRPRRFQDRVALRLGLRRPEEGLGERGQAVLHGALRRQRGGLPDLRQHHRSSRPGDYRVRVLTADDREIGRETFTW